MYVLPWSRSCSEIEFPPRFPWTASVTLTRYALLHENAVRLKDAEDLLHVGAELRIGTDLQAPGPRQPDVDDPLDPSGARRHHHHAIRQEDGLRDVVRDEQDCLPIRAPDVLKIHHGLFSRERIERAE